ncbi:MAG: hypothetical protein R3B95_08010 [Nitrospirales bacterium]|nr:hypothetical protein [Nitrospirales bacterium]
MTEYEGFRLGPKPTNRHQWICGGNYLSNSRTRLGGKAGMDVAVQTKTAGIRVPDVVWVPDAM